MFVASKVSREDKKVLAPRTSIRFVAPTYTKYTRHFKAEICPRLKVGVWYGIFESQLRNNREIKLPYLINANMTSKIKPILKRCQKKVYICILTTMLSSPSIFVRSLEGVVRHYQKTKDGKSRINCIFNLSYWECIVNRWCYITFVSRIPR